MTSVSAVAPTKGSAPQVPNGNPFLDAMMAGEGGAGGAPGGMDMSALMGMMGGAGGAGGGGAPGGMDMSALMGMMGGAGGGAGGAPGGGMDIGALMGMMGGAGGPGGAPGGAGGADGGGGGGGQMDMLTKILPYVPKILAFATKLPSFLCGYCIGLAVLLLIHLVDPVSILGLNSTPTTTGAISTTTAAVGGVDQHVLYEDDDTLPSSGLTDDLGSGGGVGGGVGAALATGFSFFAPQAGFYVVFIVLLTLVLPLYRRAKSIIEAAKYDVIRADSIAKEAKRKVAMKEHNAELD